MVVVSLVRAVDGDWAGGVSEKSLADVRSV